MQPSLASDTQLLLRLHASLNMWQNAIDGVLNENIEHLPAKEQLRAIRAWSTLIDRQTMFVRSRIEHWLQAEPKTPVALQEALRAFCKHFTKTNTNTGTQAACNADHSPVKEKYRRAKQVAVAIFVLGQYLPDRLAAGRRARFLALDNRFQELKIALALPMPQVEKVTSNYDRYLAAKTLAASISMVENELHDFKYWCIPGDDFPGKVKRIAGIEIDLVAFRNEIIEKRSTDDDWVEFIEMAISRFNNFAEELNDIANEMHMWQIPLEPGFDGDDADLSVLLARQFPEKNFLPATQTGSLIGSSPP
ncbi:MAG: hypothetical protein WA705_21160 [Candidatus Ozemobacteraceae bacterium]